MGSEGNGCIGCIIAFIVIVVLWKIGVPLLKAYFEALQGPYGGAWSIPLIFLILFVYGYFKDRNNNN